MEMNSDLRKLYVSGLWHGISKEIVLAYFSPYGHITDITIFTAEAGRSQGFAFVTFEDPNSVAAVLQSRPHEINGRTVLIKEYLPRWMRILRKRDPTHGKVFLGGLPFNVTECHIRSSLSIFGKITYVTLFFNKDTKQFRGFGFVYFEFQDSADNACAQRFVDINGKQVECKKPDTVETNQRKTPTQEYGADDENNMSHPGGYRSAPGLEAGWNQPAQPYGRQGQGYGNYQNYNAIGRNSCLHYRRIPDSSHYAAQPSYPGDGQGCGNYQNHNAIGRNSCLDYRRIPDSSHYAAQPSYSGDGQGCGNYQNHNAIGRNSCLDYRRIPDSSHYAAQPSYSGDGQGCGNYQNRNAIGRNSCLDYRRIPDSSHYAAQPSYSGDGQANYGYHQPPAAANHLLSIATGYSQALAANYPPVASTFSPFYENRPEFEPYKRSFQKDNTSENDHEMIHKRIKTTNMNYGGHGDNKDYEIITLDDDSEKTNKLEEDDEVGFEAQPNFKKWSPKYGTKMTIFEPLRLPITNADDNEIDQEAEWIFSAVFRASGGGCKQPTVVPKIKEALKLIRNHQYEPPFIALYRNENIEPDLELKDLWTILDWDEKWCHLQKAKTDLVNSLKELLLKQSDHNVVPETMRVVDESDITRVQTAQSLEEVQNCYNDIYNSPKKIKDVVKYTSLKKNWQEPGLGVPSLGVVPSLPDATVPSGPEVPTTAVVSSPPVAPVPSASEVAPLGAEPVAPKSFIIVEKDN